LIAPFIPDADEKSLGTIARLAKDLIGRARSGGLKPEEFQGGTFTVSNLGMFDVEEFIAVINPPQAAILAVGSIKQVPVVVDGAIVVGQRMNLTLSADHRVTDGAEVARYLQAVKRSARAADAAGGVVASGQRAVGQRGWWRWGRRSAAVARPHGCLAVLDGVARGDGWLSCDWGASSVAVTRG
jgi:hypothetical protein